MLPETFGMKRANHTIGGLMCIQSVILTLMPYYITVMRSILMRMISETIMNVVG